MLRTSVRMRMRSENDGANVSEGEVERLRFVSKPSSARSCTSSVVCIFVYPILYLYIVNLIH